MLKSARRFSALFGISLTALTALASTAVGAPIVVNLRVEGATKTLFEGPVSAEAIEAPGIETKSSGGRHRCDVKDNGGNGEFGAAGVAPTAALYDAAIAQHLAFDATWSSGLNDFDIEQIGEDVANSAGNGEYWGYAVNFTTAELGGCQIRLAPGSEVLWAYNFFGLPHLLDLSGPSSANAGTPFTVHVTDGQTGQPIAGAAIGQLVGGATTTTASSPTTDANGDATVTLTQSGTVALKATQAESVRSNGLTVCVHKGSDGTCGTTLAHGGEEPSLVVKAPPTGPPITSEPPAVVRIVGIKNGHTYSRRSAPRILQGSVQLSAGVPLREMRLALERIGRGRCFAFDGRRVAFKRAKCGTLSFFKVADTTSFSYLLPTPLPAGRYVYAIDAVNSNGEIATPASGVSRVGFRVK